MYEARKYRITDKCLCPWKRDARQASIRYSLVILRIFISARYYMNWDLLVEFGNCRLKINRQKVTLTTPCSVRCTKSKTVTARHFSLLNIMQDGTNFNNLLILHMFDPARYIMSFRELRTYDNLTPGNSDCIA